LRIRFPVWAMTKEAKPPLLHQLQAAVTTMQAS
jgi:hypothetical protein